MTTIDLSKINSIWFDSERMGGTPCLKGYRIPISMILSWLVYYDVDAFVKEYSVPKDIICAMLNELAYEISQARPCEIKLYKLLQ